MPLEEADLAQISELLATKLAEAEKKILQGANDGITKRLSAAEKAQQAALEKALEANKPAPPKTDDSALTQNDLKLKTLEAQVTQALQKQEEAERRAVAATQKSRNAALRSYTADALMKAGITNPQMNYLAVGHLIDSEKRIAWEDDSNDENDAKTFRDDRGTVVEFRTGLEQWLKGDLAKNFLPPKGTRGSGSSGGGNGAARQQAAQERIVQDLAENVRKM